MPGYVLDPWGEPIPLEDWLHLDMFPRAAWDMKRAQDLWANYSARLRGYGSADTKTNARIKLYLHKAVLQVSNDSIFPTADWENEKGRKRRDYNIPSKGQAADPERSAAESRRRAKAKVRDIALCNQFTHILTVCSAIVNRLFVSHLSKIILSLF